MKIKPEHLQAIVDGLLAIKDKLENAKQSYKDAGLSLIRFQWDAFRAARINGNSIKWQCDTLYPYMDDTHMQTALNAAFRRAGIEY